MDHQITRQAHSHRTALVAKVRTSVDYKYYAASAHIRNYGLMTQIYDDFWYFASEPQTWEIERLTKRQWEKRSALWIKLMHIARKLEL